MKQNEQLTHFSQQLRKNATKEENTLWYQYLRRYPVQFRRQCVIGPYIVDFYCAKAGLVLELGGSQHYEAEGAVRDAQRSNYLQVQGLMVLRFSNTDVNRNLAGVCQRIDTVVAERIAQREEHKIQFTGRGKSPHPPPSGAPSPPRGRFSKRRNYV